MPYKNPEKQKEAKRDWARRTRGGVEPVGSTGVDVVEPCVEPVRVRINPRTHLPYGPGMMGLPEVVLAEYERKYGQHEPVFGEGSQVALLAEYASSEKFERIHASLGQYAGDVRVGCFGPTVEELYQATH